VSLAGTTALLYGSWSATPLRFTRGITLHTKRKREPGRGRERERLKSPFIRSYVKRKLESGWSPEQISGRLKIDNPDLSISHEAIYQYIYIPKLPGIRSVTLKLTAEGTRSRIYPIESVRSLGIGNQILLCREPVRRR